MVTCLQNVCTSTHTYVVHVKRSMTLPRKNQAMSCNGAEPQAPACLKVQHPGVTMRQQKKKTPEGVLHICMCPARARLPILPQPSAAVLSATTGLTTEFGTGSGDPRLYCRARARRKHMAGLKLHKCVFNCLG